MNNYDNKIINDDMKFIISKIEYNRFNNKTILITGATGMIASYFVYVFIYLNENIKDFNCKIICTIRSIDKAKNRFGDYYNKEYIKYYTNDINEKFDINEKIDFIIHTASIAQTEYFKTNPIDVIRPNVIATDNLLQLATINNVESFMFLSTCSIYGKVEGNTEIKEDNLGVIDPLDTNSCYSESKRLGETLCKAYYIQKNIPVRIVRLGHTYGPTIDLDTDKRVFSEFVKNIVNNENIVLKSDGKNVRCFCYIADAIIMMFNVLLKGKIGEAYNVTNSEENLSIKELAEKLINRFSYKNIKLEFVKRDINDNYQENKFVNIEKYSNDKAVKLGYQPIINVEEGFEKTINSFEI